MLTIEQSVRKSLYIDQELNWPASHIFLTQILYDVFGAKPPIAAVLLDRMPNTAVASGYTESRRVLMAYCQDACPSLVVKAIVAESVVTDVTLRSDTAKQFGRAISSTSSIQ